MDLKTILLQLNGETRKIDNIENFSKLYHGFSRLISTIDQQYFCYVSVPTLYGNVQWSPSLL